MMQVRLVIKRQSASVCVGGVGGDLVSGPLHNSKGLQQQQHLLFGWKSEPQPAGKRALPVVMSLRG